MLKNLYIMVGFSKKERDNVANIISKKLNMVLISEFKEKCDENEEILAYIEEYLNMEKHVIYNASNVRKNWRRKLIERFKDKADEITIIYVKDDLRNALKDVSRKEEIDIISNYYFMQEPDINESGNIMFVEKEKEEEKKWYD